MPEPVTGYWTERERKQIDKRHLTIINNPSDKPISIKCTGNSVITISNISVEADSKCKPGNCSLSEQDKFEARNQCNGKSSCNITSNISNSCLLELGFFSLSYSCLEVSHICNFDDSWCGWKRKGKGKYKWKRRTVSTKTDFSGPSKDHTSGSETGSYVYSDGENGNESDTAQLTSGPIVSGHKQCLSFWYHMYGDDIGSLNVFRMKKGKKKKERIFVITHNHSNAWHHITIDLKKFVRTYQIRFKSIHGNGSDGGIALDDISIINKKCADFTSQCRSNAAACKGTSKHSQNCQHMNGTYPLEECSNIYMNIDKSSLRFYPEFNSTACSAIYQQINDSLCTNVSNWDHCTLDMSKYTQDHPECFKSYTMKTEYECEDQQETFMNSTTFTEPVFTSQSEPNTVFDITTQMTTDQLGTTNLYLQTTETPISPTSASLKVTESGTLKSKAQTIIDPPIVTGLAVAAVVCFGIILGLIILYCKRRTDKEQKEKEIEHKSDSDLCHKPNLSQMNSNTTNRVLGEADPDYQHYYEIKDIKRSPVNLKSPSNYIDDEHEYSDPDQNYLTRNIHEIGRPLNHSDYDITEENDNDDTVLQSAYVLNLQSKDDNNITDQNIKETMLLDGENNYTLIDPGAIGKEDEICRLLLPDISNSSTYVVLDPSETGFNRSTDHVCTYEKEDSNKFETSSLVNINENIIRDTSATKIAQDPKETGFSRTQRFTL
ncbi:Hypothetical predicted protein [Mytilus galloprovincialis]|uniref:MAM domain-containing protein n=1 Tax=Mytilus galloprovincialis TaxID=29158 RepID=A0A8B6HMP1_MYTGA|nr:Hypothetical predicted protein [Mytilus galloprovincialis]